MSNRFALYRTKCFYSSNNARPLSLPSSITGYIQTSFINKNIRYRDSVLPCSSRPYHSFPLPLIAKWPKPSSLTRWTPPHLNGHRNALRQIQHRIPTSPWKIVDLLIACLIRSRETDGRADTRRLWHHLCTSPDMLSQASPAWPLDCPPHSNLRQRYLYLLHHLPTTPLHYLLRHL